jgi:DNA-binding transcriptional MerR regulator
MSKTDFKTKEFLKKNELANISGVRPSTIKYYSEIGILPFQQQDVRLHRVYDRVASLERIKEIKGMKRKGFSVKQIVEYFKV